MTTTPTLVPVQPPRLRAVRRMPAVGQSRAERRRPGVRGIGATGPFAAETALPASHVRRTRRSTLCGRPHAAASPCRKNDGAAPKDGPAEGGKTAASDRNIQNLEVDRTGGNLHVHPIALLLAQKRLGNGRTDG